MHPGGGGGAGGWGWGVLKDTQNAQSTNKHKNDVSFCILGQKIVIFIHYCLNSPSKVTRLCLKDIIIISNKFYFQLYFPLN